MVLWVAAWASDSEAIWWIFLRAITHCCCICPNISRCTHYIMVARYLERCADHACKIAENVQYMETGERVEIH